MIISHLNGGLGNQMFQYACGRALADRLGVPFGLDLSHFRHQPQYEFGLDRFHIRHEPVSAGSLPPIRRTNPVKYLLWRGLGLEPRLVREKGLGFNEAVKDCSDGTYLKGYWQSERYFAEDAERIRADFELVEAPTGPNAAALDEIAAVGCVSLHIRRGDYVSDAATNATHGTCTLDYYHEAARQIAEMSGTDPVVFAFSDDPAWVSENLKLPFEMRFVSHNDGAAGHEDLRLMSACNHHIIANSSFSWWGAWLDPSPDKIVVAPKRWFANPKLSNPDIIPDGWVRM